MDSYIQFYKNGHKYPTYSESITAYGAEIPCTPLGMTLKGGTLRVGGTIGDFMKYNYIKYSNDGTVLYAWITNVTTKGANLCDLEFTVDAWRTFKSKITLGSQFIVRQPTSTYLKDNLLGSLFPYQQISSQNFSFPNSDKRILVIQVRPMQAEICSQTPVQPSAYRFYFTEYTNNLWQANPAITGLLSLLGNNAKTKNIVTMYSIPFMNISGLVDSSLPVIFGDEGAWDTLTTTYIEGFKMLSNTTDTTNLLYREKQLVMEYNIFELMRTDHNVQLVLPDSGIIRIPDEVLTASGIRLRQDIDLFSGASNYMLTDGTFNFNISVRGSALGNIPILDDSKDTYISQNQNALNTTLLTDVASIAGGVAIAGASGGAGAIIGSGAVIGGLNNILSTQANIADMGMLATNPVAFLGSALATQYSGKFWIVTTRARVSNDTLVHEKYGYPYNMLDNMVFPVAGYISTQGCMVTSDGTVPAWAIDEINAMFDQGVRVY